MLRAVVAAGALAAGCSGPVAPEPGRFTGSLARVQLDTVEIDMALSARHCADSGVSGVVLEGLDRGSAVLIWVSGGGPDSGAYPIHAAEDSVGVPHARVVLLYRTGDLAHTLALDSGTVRVDRSLTAISGDLAGAGHDLSAGFRPLLRGAFSGVPFDTEAVRCLDRS